MGGPQVFVLLKEFGFYGTGIFLLNALLILFLGVISWGVILKAYGYRFSFFDIFFSRLSGFAISYLTPSMYFGGEPVRLFILGKKHGVPLVRVGATVVVDKFLELSATFTFLFLGSIWAILNYPLPPPLYALVVGVNIFFLFLALIFWYIFITRKRVLYKILCFFKRFRWLEKFITRVSPPLIEAENEVHLAFGQHTRITLFAFFLKLAGTFFIFIKPAIFFYFLGLILRPPELALVFALTSLIYTLQIAPGSLGIFEAGIVGIYSLIGISAPHALAFALMVRVADLIGVGVGIFCIFRFGFSELQKRLLPS